MRSSASGGWSPRKARVRCICSGFVQETSPAAARAGASARAARSFASCGSGTEKNSRIARVYATARQTRGVPSTQAAPAGVVPSARMRALLFDLDGTLTRSAGAGTRALASALGARMRAAEELRKMRLDGMTDRAIARALLTAERHGGAVAEEDIDEVLAQYLVALERECAAGASRAMGGVPETIERLARRVGVLLGLCTGNLERGARLKL